MGLQIIIRGKNTYGKTRAAQEANLRKDGYAGLSDADFDKMKYAERKLGMKSGFIRAKDVMHIGSEKKK